MKKIFFTAVIILISLYLNVSAQDKDSRLNNLYTKFDSFDYEQVIVISDDLLSHKELFSKAEIIEIYRIRATAQFTVLNEDSAKNSLKQIILLDDTYSLDPVKNSPKLIDLFEELKRIYFLEKQNEAAQDSIQLSAPPEKKEVYYSEIDLMEANNLYKNSIIRSLLLPGWGHLYVGKSNLKGAMLTVSSLGALGGMVYYIIDSNKKEKVYLQESNKALINDKYNSFNKSYKIRNALITAFSAIWLYTQIDLLYFSSDDFRVSASVIPSANLNSDLQLYIGVNF